MAQVRVLSAGEERPDQPSSHRKRAERVHIAVNMPVAAALQSVVDHALAQPGGEQLSALRDALLAVENPLRVTLPTHTVGNVTFNLLRIYARP